MRDYFMKTARLGFSRWTEDDCGLAQRLWGTPEVTRYICASGVFSDAEIAARLRCELDRQQAFGAAYWPVFCLVGSSFRGCCGLRPGENSGEWELGVHLLPDCWRQGYALEGARAAIRYAFDTLGAQAVVAGHHPDNPASPGLLRRLGFSAAAPQYYAPTGLMHPSYRLTHPLR